jgi:uncharacterized repeat protein (TIGR04076 family)
MTESTSAPHGTERKARVIVSRTFGQPCPVGYHEGDHIPVDPANPDGAFRCPGVQEALAPFLETAEGSQSRDAMEFAASCHCPHSKSEVVFYLHVSPPLHRAESA